MRIGTRITLATSLLVALTLGIYGYVSVRALRSEREEQVARQAQVLAVTLRDTIEQVGFFEFSSNYTEFYRGAQLAALPWRLVLLDARDAQAEVAAGLEARRTRLRKLIAAKTHLTEMTTAGGTPTLVFAEPIRDPGRSDYRVVGAIELARDISFLDEEMREATIRMLASMLVLICVLVLVISILARRGIGRPISKLIAGIDDVTKGDLSHVLLQERDDEIGALAARFNDMTASLREARAETRRGLEAKLSLEAQLRQSEKLATIGQLAAEIAHEVGTPLNVVTGRARAMAKKAEDPEAVQKNAGIIAEQAARITRIIQRLLDFARRRVGDGEKGAVDLNRLCQDTLEFLEHQLENGRVRTRLHLAGDLAPIPGDKDQIQQVLLNLYMNAIQAMPDGGALEVTTTRVHRRRPGLEVAPEQEYVVLAVTDTGGGIPETDREKIFEPFYTSKSGGGGTGLGLAVAQGIVKDHDGWIELGDADPGTIFRVYLPVGEAHDAVSAA